MLTIGVLSERIFGLDLELLEVATSRAGCALATRPLTNSSRHLEPTLFNRQWTRKASQKLSKARSPRPFLPILQVPPIHPQLTPLLGTRVRSQQMPEWKRQRRPWRRLRRASGQRPTQPTGEQPAQVSSSLFAGASLGQVSTANLLSCTRAPCLRTFEKKKDSTLTVLLRFMAPKTAGT